MAKRGIATTAAVVLAIVTLVIGLGIGLVVYPIVFPGLQARVTQLEADVAQKQATITQLQAQVTSLQANVTSSQATITQLQAQVTSLQANVTSSQATITQLRARVAQLEADVAQKQATIRSIQGNMSSLLTELRAALITKLPADLQSKYFATRLNLTGPQKIGAIMSMSGDLASYGENEKTAAELAVSEVNAILLAAGETWYVELVVEDTQTKPDICLQKVESLNARGIKLLVGPLSSGEVGAIMSYCNAEKILAISQSSTAPALAADDYIYRYCPNDMWQGKAIGRLMWSSGIKYVVPTWRGDAWGDGLVNSGKQRFEALGGIFSQDVVRYSTVVTPDFSIEAATLNTIVTNALATYPANQVAVWALSFGEIAAYMSQAQSYPNLAKVVWYGSDGTVNEPALINPAAPLISAFAAKTNFTNPIFAPARTTKYDKVNAYIWQKLGREPDSYSYNIYDMIWAYAYSLLVTGKYDSAAVRAVFPDVTRSIYGAVGWVDFDDNGDRKPTDYDLWRVVPAEAGKYKWLYVGKWSLATDSVEWL